MKTPVVILLGNMKYLLDYSKLLREFDSAHKLLVCDLDNEPKTDLPDNSLFLQVSLKDSLKEIINYCLNNNLDVKGVINRKDYFEILHAQLANEFKVLGPEELAVESLSDKTKLHLLMDKSGLSQFRPKAIVTTLIEVDKHIKSFQFPIVMKAKFGAKSRGVYVINEDDSFQDIKKDFRQKTKVGLNEDILIEEFINGEQLSPVSYINGEGKLVTLALVDIVTSREIGQKNLQLAFRSVPSKHSQKVLNQVNKILQAIVDKTGLKYVILHPEFFVVGDHVYLIEVNVRMGGFRRSLLRNAYGVDLHKVSFQLAMGLPIDDKKLINESSTTGEVWVDQSGIIKKLKLPDHQYLKSVLYTKKVGEKYVAPPKEQRPLAIYFVKSPKDSLKIAKEIRKKTIIKFK